MQDIFVIQLVSIVVESCFAIPRAFYFPANKKNVHIKAIKNDCNLYIHIYDTGNTFCKKTAFKRETSFINKKISAIKRRQSSHFHCQLDLTS